MCTAKKVSAPVVKPADPTPTTVQPADVSTGDNVERANKRRRGRGSTELSTDRASILGGLGGGRSTLG